jgi:hypothetical protein
MPSGQKIQIDFHIALEKLRHLPPNAQLSSAELGRLLLLKGGSMAAHGLVFRGRLPPPTRQYLGLYQRKRNYWGVASLRQLFSQQLRKELQHDNTAANAKPLGS